MKKRELQFHFSGKMVRLLGRESVSSDVAALFELVKNSYDADATKVTIRFEDFSSNNSKDGKIIIEDDGDGMSFEEIEKNWMIIGTYSKDEKLESRGGRRVVGNKGIGRFATEKLAQRAILISRPRKKNEEVKIELDWKEYEDPKVTFDDVIHTAEITERESMREHGIKIILTDLRENWNKQKISDLRLSIQSIILPPQLQNATNDKFEVEIFGNNIDDVQEKKVHSLLFKNAPFKLTAHILENRTDFKVKIEKMGTVKRDEYVNLSDEDLPNKEKWKNFGKCKMTVYFFPGKNQYEDWNKYYRTALKISKIQGYLKDVCGIKIYRDRFWVRPYGEQNNDWLSLEADRVQSNLNVGNSQVIGFIEITKDGNSEIIDTTTRERLVENSSFESMKLFAREAIGVLNSYRIDENKKLREKKIKIEHQNVIELEAKYLSDIIENADLPPKEKKIMKESVSKIRQVFADFKGEMDEDIQKLESTEKVLRNLTTLGISSATTSHEVSNIIGILAEIPKSIAIKLKKEPIPKESILSDLKEADEKITAIKQFMLFIRHFVMSLREDYETKHEKSSIRVSQVVNHLLERFSPVTDTMNIEVSLVTSPEDAKVFMNKADLESILVNLLTNSLKALGTIDEKKKRIKISIQKDARHFKIRFSDNGPGIKENNHRRIFELFFSTYKDGTGLGLPIVKEIVEDYNGKIEIKSTSDMGNGATFEITIPSEELQK